MQVISIFGIVIWWSSKYNGASAHSKGMGRRILRKDIADGYGLLHMEAAANDSQPDAFEEALHDQQIHANDLNAARATEHTEWDWFSDIASPFHDVPLQAFSLHASRATQAQTSIDMQKIRKDEFFFHIPGDEGKKQARVIEKLEENQASVARQRLTSWHCIPAHASDLHCFGGKFCAKRLRHHTCKFQNLYLFCDGSHGCQLEAHTLSSNKSKIPPMASGVTANFQGAEYNIVQRIHDSLEDFFHSVVKLPPKYLEYEHKDLTLMYSTLYHFNIGHGLFDGFYPAFVSLLQHGDQHRPFQNLLFGGRTLEVAAKCQVCFKHVEDVFGRIGQKGTLNTDDLKKTRDGKPTVHRFTESVLGVGTNSAKIDVNVNYTLGACRDLDACRALRNRVYQSLKLDSPHVVRRKPPFRITVVFNKRFGDPAGRPGFYGQWPNLVEFLRNASTDESGHFLKDFQIQGVVWTEAKKAVDIHGMSQYSVQLGDFKDHMKLISETDVHISSPGTAQMYQTFLPDGAVHINMGQEGSDASYMEEYMAEGAPYLRALYYPPRSQTDSLFRPRTMLTLLRAAHFHLKRGITDAVPVNMNLSPVGRVAKAFAYFLHEEATGQSSIPPLQREVQGLDWNGNEFPSIAQFYRWAHHENTDALTSLMQLYDQGINGKTKFFAASSWYQRILSETSNRTAQHANVHKFMDLASGPHLDTSAASILPTDDVRAVLF